MRCDACVPRIAPVPRQKSDRGAPILDEAMIGLGQRPSQYLACFAWPRIASRRMVWYGWVVVHHVRMHRACESSFSVLLLLVHHNVFEILLCAYYSEREKRERERGLVRASGSVFKQIGNKSSQKGWLSVSNWVSQHVACCLYTNSHGRYQQYYVPCVVQLLAESVMRGWEGTGQPTAGGHRSSHWWMQNFFSSCNSKC